MRQTHDDSQGQGSPPLDRARASGAGPRDPSWADDFDALLGELISLEDALRAERAPARPDATPEQVLDALWRVSDQIRAHPLRAQDGAPARPPPRLAMIVGGRLGSAGDCLIGSETLLLLRFNDHLFARLGSVGDLDPLAERLLWSYQPVLAGWWIRDRRALVAPAHPARQLLELLVRVLRGLDAYSGQRALALAEEIRLRVLDGLKGIGRPAAAEEQTRALVDLLNRYWRELRPREERLKARERGRSSLSDARQRVEKALVDALAGKSLPKLVVEFLRDVWAKYLHVTYLRDGIDSAAWRQGVETIDALLDSVTTADAEGLKRDYGTRISPLIERLRQGAAKVHAGQAQPFELFLQGLDVLHMSVMEGSGLDPAELVTLPPAGVAGARAQTPAAALAPAAALRAGGWYRLTERGRTLRARLVENHRDHGYLLFDNLSGIKVARIEYPDVVAGLARGELAPIDQRQVFEPLVQLCLEDWRADLARARDELQRLRLDRTVAAARSAREAREQARQRAELARLEAEELAREEELRLAEARGRREAAARAEAERSLREQAIASKAEELQRLRPGARAELIDGSQRRIVCELALVLRSSRKLIFVDRLGKRVAELRLGELAARVVDGSAQILSFGLTFDQTLERVIEGGNRPDSED